MAVFNIDGSLLNTQNVNLDLSNASGATTIVFNVSGKNVTIGDNFGGGFQNNSTKIIYNFFNADSVTVNREIYGAFLAPTALLTNTSPIDGPTFVNTFNQGAEIHLPTQSFNGTPGFGPTTKLFPGLFPVSAVPEPGSIALLTIGGAGALTALRKKKARAGA